MRHLLRKVALAGLPAIVVVLGLSATGPAQADPPTIRLGYGVAAEEPLWLVIAKPDLGTNAGKSYKLEATRFVSSDKRAQALEAGAIDIASSSANGVIFAAASGAESKIIASISRESRRGFSTSFYVLNDSPIKTVKDIKGATVAINGFSTSGELWLKAALEKDGLQESDVSIIPTPFSAMQPALESKKIDVAELPQPFAALAEKQLNVRKVFDSKYGVPFDEELIVLSAKDDYLKKNAGAVRGLLEDLRAAMQFYLDKPREARQFLTEAKMVRVDPDVYVALQDYYHEPTLRPDVEALEKMQAFQIKAGFQKTAIDVKSIVDTSYLPK